MKNTTTFIAFDLTTYIGLKTPAQQLAHLHQQQQQRQQHLQQLHGQQIRHQQHHAIQQPHPLNIKQEVVDNTTGQTQQTLNQNNSNNISQNIGGTNTGNNGVIGVTQPHVNKASANGHFVDSTTTNPMTTLAGFSTQNNNSLSRSGSCDNISGPGTSSESNRDLFSLQEELLNGTFCQLSSFFFELNNQNLTTNFGLGFLLSLNYDILISIFVIV